MKQQQTSKIPSQVNFQGVEHIKAILFDTEGPWLSGSWDMLARMQLAELFALEYDDLEQQHTKNYKYYQSGAISFGQYTQMLLSGQKGQVSRTDFDRMLRVKLLADKETLNYLKRLKSQYKIKILAVNDWFGQHDHCQCPAPHLEGFIDAFVLSAAGGDCLSDGAAFKEAVDSLKVKPAEVVCFDDRQHFIQTATALGMKGLLHVNMNETKLKFRQYGLIVNI